MQLLDSFDLHFFREILRRDLLLVEYTGLLGFFSQNNTNRTLEYGKERSTTKPAQFPGLRSLLYFSLLLALFCRSKVSLIIQQKP